MAYTHLPYSKYRGKASMLKQCNDLNSGIVVELLIFPVLSKFHAKDLLQIPTS